MQQMNLQPGLGYLSWSRLAKYNSCGEKYRLTYVEGIPGEPSGAALAGKAIHQAIRDAEVRESWADPDDDFTMEFAFAETFSQSVDSHGGPEACRWGGRKDRDGIPNEGFLWWLQYAGPLMLKRYKAVRLHDQELGDTLVDAEFEVSVNVADRLVVGYIDALMVRDDGEAYIRDWKTGRQRDPYQLGVYSWLLANSERHITADIGEIGYLRGTKPFDYITVYPLREWRELVPRMMEDLIKGVDADLYPLRPSPFCVACDVRAACPYGRTLGGGDKE